MLLIEKNKYPTLISDNKVSSNINSKSSFLYNINSIKNISVSETKPAGIALNLPDVKIDADETGSNKTSAFRRGLGLLSFTAGIGVLGKIAGYFRGGDEGTRDKGWLSALPAKEYSKAKELISIVGNPTPVLSSDAPYRNTSLSEALIRAMAAITLSPHLPGIHSQISVATGHVGFTRSLEGNIVNHDAIDVRSQAYSQYYQNAAKRAGNKQKYWMMAEKQQKTKPTTNIKKRHRRKTMQNFSPYNLPACVIDERFKDYWIEVLTNISKYPALNKNLQNTSVVNMKFASEMLFRDDFNASKTLSWSKNTEENDWPPGVDSPNNFPPDSANLTHYFIDTLLSDLIQKNYGITLTSRQLDQELKIDIHYTKTEHGVESYKFTEHGTYLLRQILLQEPSKAFHNPSKSENSSVVIQNISIQGSADQDYLSYIEFIVNGGPARISAGVGRLMNFFLQSRYTRRFYHHG
ncbi:hypothetical protein ABK905_20905 [Acerihabitans sp. KWT182]|uniref:Uncharacterized protein n=1 Tax=Acerihabitans sp. KWT182 TaxID=3157919 RepID=A0AAU7Q7R3_9GAMM